MLEINDFTEVHVTPIIYMSNMMIKQDNTITILTTKQLEQWFPKLTMEIYPQVQQEKEGKELSQNMDIAFK